MPSQLGSRSVFAGYWIKKSFPKGAVLWDTMDLAEAWDQVTDWQQPWPLQTPIFNQNTAITSTAVALSSGDSGHSYENNLTLEQITEKYRRDIEKLKEVRILLEELSNLKAEINLISPRINQLEANSHSLQHGLLDCSCNQGLLLTDMVTTAIERSQQDMRRAKDLQTFISDLSQTREDITGMKDELKIIKDAIALANQRFGVIEAKMDDFTEYVTDMTAWFREELQIEQRRGQPQATRQ